MGCKCRDIDMAEIQGSLVYWTTLCEGPRQALKDVAQPWFGTKRMKNARKPSIGVSCAQLAADIYSKLYGISVQIREPADDASLHSPTACWPMMRDLKRQLPIKRRRDHRISPGDLLVCRGQPNPQFQGGAGHLMIAMPRPFTAVHAGRTVELIGLGAVGNIVAVYEALNKERWASCGD